MTELREALNAFPGVSLDQETDHFYTCSCGQSVDYRRLGDVLHHEECEEA